ncbi:hypothetical protein MASR2M29_08150 [Spirochaetota bacterium]
MILLTIFIGMIITLHMSMNAYAGHLAGNTKMANLVFWAMGLSTSIIISFTQKDPGFMKRAMGIPPWLFLAGGIGATISLFTNSAIPLIGSANLTMLLLAGQLAASVVVSHFGIMGSPLEPVAWYRIAGVALAGLGAALSIYGGKLFPR